MTLKQKIDVIIALAAIILLEYSIYQLLHLILYLNTWTV